MFNPTDGLFKQFLKSPHHLWLAGLTLGIGFISANIFVFAVTAAIYALGWIYLPESPLFKKWVQQHLDVIQNATSQQQVEAFMQKRKQLVNRLDSDDREKYDDLVRVCRDIEQATKDNTGIDQTDPRLRKLDELMWTYLKLLVMHESLESFLSTEKENGLQDDVNNSQKEVDAMDQQNKTAIEKGTALNPVKAKLLESKRDRLNTIKARLDKIHEAKDNQVLVSAEQDRVVEQIKLLRADAIATHNPDTLSARIDVTVQNLTTTNEMMSQMNQFKELVADDLPPSQVRLGFSSSEAEPESDESSSRPRRRTALRN